MGYVISLPQESVAEEDSKKPAAPPPPPQELYRDAIDRMSQLEELRSTMVSWRRLCIATDKTLFCSLGYLERGCIPPGEGGSHLENGDLSIDRLISIYFQCHTIHFQ